jgi:MFS family permease
MLSDVQVPVDRVEQATPLITGFLAGYVAAMPLLAALSDARGRAPAFAACLASFAAGSAITALSGSVGWLVTGRVLQGLGGGALVPLTLALAADLHAGRTRPLALGTVSAVQEAGSLAGPLYGAAVASVFGGLSGWRFVFWANLGLAGLVLAALLRFGWQGSSAAGRTPLPSASPGSPPVGRIDWPGAALLGLGLALAVVALYPDDPSSRPVNGLFAPLALGSAACLLAFGWSQARRRQPLVPTRLLGSAPFLGSLAANLLAGAGLMVALVDVPVMARAIYGLDQLGAGLLLTRFLAGVPLGALAGGWLAGRLGSRPVAVAGLLAAATAFWLMSAWGMDEFQAHAVAGTAVLLLCGFAFGVVTAPLASALLAASEAGEHGMASSLGVLARTLGMLLGLSALTAFGLARFYRILGGLRLQCAGDLRSRLSCLDHAVALSLLEEYREIYLLTAGVCLLAAAVALLTLRRGRAPA